MALTLAEILRDPLFRRCRLLTDADQAREVVVRGVSVIEVPVEQFVRRNELVLTTAMNVGHDPRRFSSFVRRIAGSKAAALAVAIGPYIRAVPPPIVDLASGHNLALLELRPWKLRFSEVSERVLRRLLEDEFRSKERDNFVWGLATGRLKQDERVPALAERFGIDARSPFYAVAATPRVESRTPPVPLDDVLDDMARLGEALADARGIPWLGTTIGGRIIAFIGCCREPTHVEALLKQWTSQVAARLPGVITVVGMSERFDRRAAGDWTAYAEAAAAAIEVVDLAAGQAGPGIVGFRMVATDVLLRRAAREHLGPRIVTEYLGALIDHDRRRKMKLLPTLEAYLHSNGNISACARALDMRRQSLMYRLEIIGRLTRCDLEDADARLSLQIALRVLRQKLPSASGTFE